MNLSPASVVLCYHSVDPSGSVISVSPAEFRRHMDALAASGRPIVTLSDVMRRPGAIAITFDDAFRNFYQVAFPILQERRFPATVFTVSGHTGGKNNWSTQPPGIPLFDLMTWTEVQEVARHGVEVGAHTVTHPHLPNLAPQKALCEMQECQDEISHRIGQPVKNFAYPYGDCDSTVRSMASGLFEASCGTRLDFLRTDSDRAELSRIDAYYVRDLKLFQKVIQGNGGTYIRNRRTLRQLRAMVMS
jgi:peptidoglycan/xylan/chitin deacetylase (PgdA/CDA1 family)